MDYALAHKDSLIRVHFPSQKDAARSAYQQIVSGLIRVHYRVIPTHNPQPVRVWASEGSIGKARGWSPTVDVLTDPDRRNDLVLREIGRMLGIFNAYKLDELHEVYDLLLRLQGRFTPRAEAAE